MNKKIIVGIDPGVKTGLAVWNIEDQEFMHLKTVSIVEAIRELAGWNYRVKEIRFEDARLRTWFEEPKNSKGAIAKLQGVGSVKRDCAIWQEFCEYYKVPFQAVKPEAGNTKWTAEYFKRVTGWTQRTTVHSRDAGVLVFGIK